MFKAKESLTERHLLDEEPQRSLGRMRVTADGDGVVSHAGTELLREMDLQTVL